MAWQGEAAEAVDREILHFPAVEADGLKLYNQKKACQRCGQHGHTGATSEFSILAQPKARAC